MNNKIGLESLRVLDAIESAGSFQGAAQMLHKVPSAVSHAVSKLEGDLGVALYDRSGRRAHLTQAGREVLAQGRRILRAVGELEARARYAADGWEPEFTIVLDHLLPLQLLLPALVQFRQHAPEVVIKIIRETLDGTWDALLWRRANLAIGAGGMGPPGSECEAHILGELELKYVVAPGHPLAAESGEVEVASLLTHCYIESADTTRVAQPRMRALVESHRQLCVVDLRDKLEALRAAHGFGLLPAAMAVREIAAGRLVELHTEASPASLIVQAAARRQASGKALDWFVSALQTSGSEWLAQAYN